MIKNNKTESEIFAQIKETLGQYEEGYIPGSWENFLQKRKSHDRKIFLRIASGIAACLLAGFLGVNYFQSEVPSGKWDRSVATAVQSSKGDTSVAIIEQSAKSDRTVATAVQTSKSDKSVATAEQSAKIIREKPLTAAVAGSDSKQPANAALKETPTTGQNKSPTAEVQINIPNQQLGPDFTSESREQVAALQTKNKSQSTVNKIDTTIKSPDTTRSKTQNIFLTTPQTGNHKPLADTEKRKVRFGINFSPGVNTTESTGSLNYTGGVSADFPISSKIALSTGLQVENQSFVKEMPGIVSTVNAPVNQTKTKLTNLDLPVNLTWKFAAEKTHAYYVSAGLSSLVYLKQENKNTTYSQDLIPVSSLVNGEEIKSYNILSTMSVTQNAVTPAQTFDLAGRINLMVGFETQLSSRIYIHFEPYAKIPTSSQAAGSLNHTTTGVNFKISF